LNIGRYYHSSLLLSNKFLYIFCGRDSLTEKAISSIERLNIDQDMGSFQEMEIKPLFEGWSARDTVGIYQISKTKILIFGGDFGWISDSFLYDTEDQTMEKITSLKKNEAFFN
jgi:hypothetical protein